MPLPRGLEDLASFVDILTHDNNANMFAPPIVKVDASGVRCLEDLTKQTTP